MARGWTTTVNMTTDLGQGQAHYIVQVSSRSFTRETLGEGLVRFTFPPGQRCFQRHVMSLEREPLFIVRDGARRGSRAAQGAVRRHASGDDWVDDMSAHLDRIRNQ